MNNFSLTDLKEMRKTLSDIEQSIIKESAKAEPSTKGEPTAPGPALLKMHANRLNNTIDKISARYKSTANNEELSYINQQLKELSTIKDELLIIKNDTSIPNEEKNTMYRETSKQLNNIEDSLRVFERQIEQEQKLINQSIQDLTLKSAGNFEKKKEALSNLYDVFINLNPKKDGHLQATIYKAVQAVAISNEDV